MKTIQERAKFYKGLGIWIYPYLNYYDSFQWNHWRNMDDSCYEKEYNTYDWNTANGLNVVAGEKKGECSMFLVTSSVVSV
jgi:hypothetical protein